MKIMTPNIQTKALLVASVCAAAVLAAGVLAVAPRTPGSVVFGVQHYTNGYAYFSITNLHRFPVQYGVAIERKWATGWPDYFGEHSYSPGPLRHEPPDGLPEMPALAPRQSSTFRVCVTNETGPWRLSVCYFRKQTVLDSARFRAAEFFASRGMRKLESRFYPRVRAPIVTGAEMTNFTICF